MSNSDYVQVRSHYYPRGDNPDLIIEADGVEDKEWIYAFYNDSDIPDYMKLHSERNQAAEKVENETKISRITDQHLNEDAEKEWRILE